MLNTLKPIINIVTVVQARTSSTRLPNKVFLSLAGKPLLLRLIERIKYAKLSGTVVVATTTDISDDPIFNLCLQENINVFRGHKTDLLGRHVGVGLKYDADVIVKIPSDCPLIDPKIINRVIKFFIDNQHHVDYVSNLHPATYPDGNDVEAISFHALLLAHHNAKQDFEREHTTPFLWENNHIFRVRNVEWDKELDYSMTHRWTIDYEEDYIFIKSVYDELYHRSPNFSMYDILNLLSRKPELAKINEKYCGVNWYRHHLHQLKTININQTKVLK